MISKEITTTNHQMDEALSPFRHNHSNKKQSLVIIKMPEIIEEDSNIINNNPSNHKLPLLITVGIFIIMSIAATIFFICSNTIKPVQTRSLLTTEFIQSAKDPHLTSQSMKSLLDTLLSNSHQATLTTLSFSEWMEFIEALQQSRICNTDTWSMMANKIKKIESSAFNLGNFEFWHDLKTHDKILEARSGRDILKALDPIQSEGSESILYPSDFGVYIQALYKFQALYGEGMIQKDDEDSIELLNKLLLNPNQEMWSKLDTITFGTFLESIAEITKETFDAAAIFENIKHIIHNHLLPHNKNTWHYTHYTQLMF